MGIKGLDMSIESLVNELKSLKSFDVVDVRAKIEKEFNAATTSEQRDKVLAIFTATMDQVERNLTNRSDQSELLEEFRKARAQDYKVFIFQECTVGLDSPGGGDVSVEMLMAVTNREIAAGRMTEDHSLRKIAVERAAIPHLSNAELLAKHAKLGEEAVSLKAMLVLKTLGHKLKILIRK